MLVPLPLVVAPPGYCISVHSPEEGSPLIVMLPVAKSHVGWVIVPITGADGVGGCALMTTGPEDVDVHPSSFLTVNVYVVPAARFEIVVLVPDPVVVAPPGDRVSVQVPVAGRPFSTTLPVETLQVGWVMVPTTGAVGVTGWGLMVTVDVGGETQPMELVTVKL